MAFLLPIIASAWRVTVYDQFDNDCSGEVIEDYFGQDGRCQAFPYTDDWKIDFTESEGRTQLYLFENLSDCQSSIIGPNEILLGSTPCSQNTYPVGAFWVHP